MKSFRSFLFEGPNQDVAALRKHDAVLHYIENDKFGTMSYYLTRKQAAFIAGKFTKNLKLREISRITDDEDRTTINFMHGSTSVVITIEPMSDGESPLYSKIVITRK